MRRLMFLVVLFFSIFLSGCSRVNRDEPKPIHTSPSVNSISNAEAPAYSSPQQQVSLKDIKLVKKANKTQYLLTNGIEIKYNNKSISTEKGEIQIFLPQIKGLSDKALEDKINKNIHADVDKEVKNFIAEQDSEQMVFAECGVELNANNLLSISIRGYYTPPKFGLLYRLTDGTKLSLKDIFTEGTDYVALLNRKVVEGIAGEDISEEYLLKEPFKTIDSDQNFVLSGSDLYMVFHKGEKGFYERSSVKVPLSEIDDYVDVTDRYSSTQRKTQLRSEFFIRNNNIFVATRGEVYKRDIGNLWIHYPVIAGIKNSDYEKKINSIIRNSINEIKDSSVFIGLPKGGEEYRKDCIAIIDFTVTFNHYGILSIERNIETLNPNNTLESLHKVYCFDLRKYNEADVKSLISNYLAKSKAKEDAFVNSVRQSLTQECTARKIKIKNLNDFNIDFDFIKQNGLFYFTKRFDEDELLIHISFTGKGTNGADLITDCQIPLKTMHSTAPEDFFGW